MMNDTPTQYYIHIIEFETGKIVKCMGPTYERRAEKIERGVLINLNREAYGTVLVSEDEHEEHEEEEEQE
jgi:hypothetical protein